MKKNTIVIAGGGTGGHLYPGLAVARELQSQIPGVDIHFVGSRYGLENKIVPKEGFPLHRISVGGLIRAGRIAQLKTLVLLPFAFIQSLVLLLRLRPKVVLGIGGYAAGPLVLVASFLVRETYIWEPNAHPGFTNRVLSRFVKLAFVVFDSAKSLLHAPRTLNVGFPTRKNMIYQAREKGANFRVLVFGGSQGARAINRVVQEAFISGDPRLSGIELVHQTGRLDFAQINSQYAGKKNVTCLEFIDDMPKYYQWADLVIGRGGVGTVSEIISCRKASVIIPLPTAAENHQQANAMVLVNARAGEMILQKEFTASRLLEVLDRFKNNPSLISEIEEKLKVLQRPSGAATIVAEMKKAL